MKSFQVEISQEAAEYKTGDDIRLECRAEGFPIPSIQWLKNNARLPKSTRIYVEDEKVLVVKNASPIGNNIWPDRNRIIRYTDIRYNVIL